MLQLSIGNARYQCSCVRYVTSELENLWLIVGLSAGLGLLLAVVLVVSLVLLCRRSGGKSGGQSNDLELNEENRQNIVIQNPAAAHDNPEYHENVELYQENVGLQQHSTIDPDGRHKNPNQNYLTPRDDIVNQNYPTPSAPGEDIISQNYLRPTDADTDHNYSSPYDSQLPDYLEIIGDYQ